MRVLLEAHLGREVAISTLTRTPSPFATLFPADVLSVVLEGGVEIRMFVKCLGPEEQDHPDKSGPEKEVAVYRELLDGAADAGMPVPRCFGSRWNTETRRFELFLEYVDDWNLEYQGMDEWYRAAAELGRLHGWFSRRVSDLQACGVLPRLGAKYAWGWARRAEAEAARRGRRLGDRLRELLAEYEVVAATLEEALPTLVHNDLSPKNVVADRSSRPTRICLVDWESAGIGCGLLDLTNLQYGLEEEERERMWAAYRRGLGATGGEALPAPAEGTCLAVACEAHKALWRLAHCGIWDLADAAVAGFAAEAEEGVRRLLELRRSLGRT